jgi:hypothetical protein
METTQQCLLLSFPQELLVEIIVRTGEIPLVQSTRLSFVSKSLRLCFLQYIKEPEHVQRLLSPFARMTLSSETISISNLQERLNSDFTDQHQQAKIYSLVRLRVATFHRIYFHLLSSFEITLDDLEPSLSLLKDNLKNLAFIDRRIPLDYFPDLVKRCFCILDEYERLQLAHALLQFNYVCKKACLPILDYFDRHCQSCPVKFDDLYTYKPPTKFEESKYKLLVRDHHPVEIQYLSPLRKSFSLSVEDKLFVLPDIDIKELYRKIDLITSRFSYFEEFKENIKKRFIELLEWK